MILLESGHRLVAESVKTVINPDPDFKSQPFETKVYDFDEALYLIQVKEKSEDSNNNAISVSLSLPCYQSIKEYGAWSALLDAFNDLLQPEPEPGYDVTVTVTSTQWAGKEAEIIDKLSKLKCIALGGVFEHFYSAINREESANLSPFKFNIRPDTTVYFVPDKDRVTTIFQLSFIDQADTEIGRVFLNEFADPAVRRKVNNSPVVNYDVNPPRELSAFGISQPSKGDLGFVTFVILKNHSDPKVRVKVSESLQVFRNFVQYHLKCAKSFFHSRMRLRVAELLKVLNRAQMKDVSSGPKRITTAGGRVLIR